MSITENETLYALSQIKELLRKESEEKVRRTKIFSEQIGWLLESIPSIFNFVNENDPILRGKIFSELGFYIRYQKHYKGSVIQHIGSVDDIFYINMTGSILKLDIKYKTLNITYKEYVLYLSKLYLLNEKYMINEIIKKNNKVFPLPENGNIIKYGYMIKSFRYQEELDKIKEIKAEVESDLSGNRSLIKKIEDLIMLYNPNIKINNNCFFSCEELTYKICLPFFYLNKIMKPVSFLGNLNRTLGIKNLSLFICLDNCDVLYLDKNILKSQNNNKIYNLFNRKKSEFIINNLFAKHYLFKNIDIKFLQKNYAKYFEIFYPEKNEVIIHQNAPRNGIFFINKGTFSITSFKNYNEVTILNYYIKKKLNKNKFIKFEPNKNSIEKNIILKKNPFFMNKANIKQLINFGNYSVDDIIGLNDIYESTKLSYDFSVECISNGGEIFHMPNEIYNSLIKNVDISSKINAFIERRLKIFENVVEKFQLVFEYEIKKQLYKDSIKDSINNINNNNNQEANIFPFIAKQNNFEENKNFKNNKYMTKSTSMSDFNYKTKNPQSSREHNNFNFDISSQTMFDKFYYKKKKCPFNLSKRKSKSRSISSMNESIKKRMNELSMFYSTTNNLNKNKETLFNNLLQNNQNISYNKINDLKNKNMNIKQQNGSMDNIKMLPVKNFKISEANLFKIRKNHNLIRKKSEPKFNKIHNKNDLMIDKDSKINIKMIKVKSRNEI